MESTAVYFTAPGRVELRTERLPDLQPGQVLVETELSAISAGTEMLVYRGQFPRDLADANDQVSRDLHYPLSYGYASVGHVKALGAGADPAWQERSAESPPCSSEFAFIGVNSRFSKTLLARAIWPALPATRAVARTHNKESY